MRSHLDDRSRGSRARNGSKASVRSSLSAGSCLMLLPLPLRLHSKNAAIVTMIMPPVTPLITPITTISVREKPCGGRDGSGVGVEAW